MTPPLYSVVIYTSQTDAQPGVVLPDMAKAQRLYALVASVTRYPVALYRHDGPKGTCIRRHDPSLVAA